MTHLRLALAAGALVAIIAAFLFGRSTGIDHQRTVDAKAMAKAQAAMTKGLRAIDVLNGRVAAAQRDQSTETRDIHYAATRYLDRPVYRDRCIDADGGRLLDRAAANANRGLAGEPAGDPARASEDAPQR